MNRRDFIIQGSVITSGYHLRNLLSLHGTDDPESDLYAIFKNPNSIYRPFVRWWWNGDKIEKQELARELRLLKTVGIGGVEINPIKFPERTNDLEKHSLQWLSDEWIDILKFTVDEAQSLGLSCDLIVGSGWPFGAEWLQGEERSQIVVIGTKKLTGPLDYEVSLFDLFKESDPAISSPFPGRTVQMLSVQLVPATINSLSDVKDLSDQIPNGTIKCKIPEGKFVLYAVVRISGFMQVIQGAPGATGPVLNHYNETAVKKYLSRMSDAIKNKIGPLSARIRSLFTDSLELEGANWCIDMASEFKRRRGYDLMPWLPFILYKIASMGSTWVYDHGAEFGAEFRETIGRIRYDFELTKAELIDERFVRVFITWCKEHKVQSRMQAYGRGYFPLEGSFNPDVPECETWIRPGLGTEMSDSDYRIGRAYTMINKYVSSAAHLRSKKLISCEELTNIHMVFNETLELMKVAADQSIISGTTHSVFHGFNYSPPNAPFPGWVIYGTFINERSPWWPYFKLFVDYKTRLSALLQHATMFADIAVLPATADLWSMYGAQNDPFPGVMYPEWQTLVWESIHQNGSGCDYVSEKVIQNSTIENGSLKYGSRKYHSLFMTKVESIAPSTAKKIFEFVSSGGKVFFIEAVPSKAPGWKDREQRDKEVQEWIGKTRSFTDRAILLEKPGANYTAWFTTVQKNYSVKPYVKVEAPAKFITQVRYQARNAELLLFTNSNMNASYELAIAPSMDIVSGKQAWLWDAETGERFKLPVKDGVINLQLGPADLKLLVFDNEKRGRTYPLAQKSGLNEIQLNGNWYIRGEHVNGSVLEQQINELKDLKEIPEWLNFSGTVVYSNNFVIQDVREISWLNLGRVLGVCEAIVNGRNAGTKWYGSRIYQIKEHIHNGSNRIEIKVVTTLGNYLKSLTDNKIGQYWTNEGNKIQPVQSMGMLGPVTLY